jgi:hypothetical protein
MGLGIGLRLGLGLGLDLRLGLGLGLGLGLDEIFSVTPLTASPHPPMLLRMTTTLPTEVTEALELLAAMASDPNFENLNRLMENPVARQAWDSQLPTPF